MAALGGDGTLHQVVNALFRDRDPADAPAVLPLAGGALDHVLPTAETAPPDQA